MKIWTCKIGEIEDETMTENADLPLRTAIAAAYIELTGRRPKFIFSGWGGKLTDAERDVADCTCGTWPHEPACARAGKPMQVLDQLDAATGTQTRRKA